MMWVKNILPKTGRLGISPSKYILLALLLITTLTGPRLALAEFALNFMPESSRFEKPKWLAFNCNLPRANGEFEDCDKNDLLRKNNDQDATPFLFERVSHPGTSDQYYHTIIGLPGSDFVQEAYIKISRYLDKDDCKDGNPCTPSSTPQVEVKDLGPISDSHGDWRSMKEYFNNGFDPMGPAAFSGNGTANPKNTQFRQVMGDDGFTQDITKATFNKKHKLTQDLNAEAGKVIHSFELDMTNSTFDQADIAGVMVRNYTEVRGSTGSPIAVDITDDFYQGRGGFDINGGKYSFTRKYDETIGLTSFENEYSGEGSGYDIWNEDWKKYYDPAQNRNHLYGCYEKCEEDGNGKFEPYAGGRTWANWSDSEMHKTNRILGQILVNQAILIFSCTETTQETLLT